MVEIARLPRERWKDYRDLRLEALRSDPAAFGSSAEEEERLTEDDWKMRIQNVLFALLDDRPVGMIVVAFSDRPKKRHVADIFGVYVTPECRGEGIGRKLLESALSQVQKNKNVIKVKLTANPEQRAAVELYESIGFKAVGRMKKELKVGRRLYDELLMEKVIPRR